MFFANLYVQRLELVLPQFPSASEVVQFGVEFVEWYKRTRLLFREVVTSLTLSLIRGKNAQSKTKTGLR